MTTPLKISIRTPEFGQHPRVATFAGRFLASYLFLLICCGSVNLRAQQPAAEPARSPAERQRAELLDQSIAARAELARDFRALGNLYRNAQPQVRDQALEMWHTTNQGRIEAMQQTAKRLAEVTPPPPLRLIREVEVPEDASPAMEAFLVARAQLHNGLAQALDQLRNATPQARQNALDQWHQRNAPLFEAQQQRAKQLAAEAESVSMRLPARPNIPVNATPALRAFLTERFALMQNLARWQNQSGTARSEDVFEAWSKANATRMERVQTLARQIATE